MKLITKLLALIIFLIVMSSATSIVFAQFRTDSNTVKTRVGNPPVEDTGQVSCPLSGKRTIGCGSFMSESRFNRGVCRGPRPIDYGHCGVEYCRTIPNCCWTGDPETTKVQRWAQSIDVDALPGETVKAPLIDGQSARWYYVTDSTYAVDDRAGGGFGHGYVATVGTTKWMIYTVHMNRLVPPPPNGKPYYDSGDIIATVANTDYDHLHFNIGKNVTNRKVDPGWLSPEKLGICTD